MKTLAQRYSDLKQQIGGNREITEYEETFGMSREEQAHITPPSKFIRRILAELEFSIRLSEENGGKFHEEIGAALTYLSDTVAEEGVLTKTACLKGEEMLLPLAEAAKEYKLILAGHAHIDMNWLWGWHETVAATLATFRTMLTIMDEYPTFCFSQSQASVYKIVEEFEPELMEPIKKRIAEGRWEVTASAWVETDKNMPNTESLLRHIRSTKRYLRDTWGIAPEKLEVDFSPDTFGHSANLPEIDAHGGVKYYYHCRGLDGKQALYRYKGLSGQEMLCYREQYWYNSGITPKVGIGIVDIAKRSGGLKTGLVVYGVGDHGGGPTRRDVERALEMMEWPIFPAIKFGTFREFFQAAETVRDRLPLVEHELNYIFQGCYTTQSRIKMGNRACERALTGAETMEALASLGAEQVKSVSAFREKAFEKAWQDVLFTHFHDILTGSCVRDSREHAMGLFSNSMAVAQTRYTNAALRISEQIDTSGIPEDENIADAQSEGAGVGYGVEGFVNGMPRAERGRGKTRIFHIFNSTPVKKYETVELTVWDWTGDLRRVEMTNATGTAIPCQRLDESLQRYWDHQYFRVLALCEVEPFGYATIVLREKPLGNEYPLYYQPDIRTHKAPANFVLENEKLRAEFCYKTGGLLSLTDRKTGKEYVKPGQSGGFRYVDTESATSSAWNIGNYLKVTPVCDAVKLRMDTSGALKTGFTAEYQVKHSTVKMQVSLSKNANSLCYRTEVDWHEISGDTIPVLTYELPLAEAPAQYLYDIPAGSLMRPPLDHDVPALQYGLAVTEGLSAGIVTESKYGYRGTADGRLLVTLINSSRNPDPYPERGIHQINFHVGLFDSSPKVMEDTATSLNNGLTYQPATSHRGTLPTDGALLRVETAGAVVSALEADADGGILVRLYNPTDAVSACTIPLPKGISSASLIDLMGNEKSTLPVKDGAVSVALTPFSVQSIRLR